MSGFIEFHSVLGHGTTFRVYLPLCKPPPPPKTGEHAAREFLPVSSGEGVLLVDDELYILEAAKAMLESSGFTVFQALHAEEAQGVLTGRLQDIHLAVLDLTMPRISGARLAKILKQLKPDLKILVSSGYNLEGELSPEELMFIDGTLQKPYRMEELLQAVHKVMKGSARE
jgi:CheY-like chemotaxis protein